MFEDEGVAVDIETPAIDQLITMLDAIINELSGDLGYGTLGDIELTIEDELEGEYQGALTTAFYDIKLSYSESLSNVIAIRAVLEDYKQYISNGPTSKLATTDTHLKYDTKVISTQINYLDQEIGPYIKKVLASDEEFETWRIGYDKSLDDGLLRNTYTVDDVGNIIDDSFFNKQSAAEQLFKDNATVLDQLNFDLADGFTLTNGLVEKLEVESGIISGELTNLSEIWTAFDLNQIDARNFSETEYNNQKFQRMQENQAKLQGEATDNMVQNAGQALFVEAVKAIVEVITNNEDGINQYLEQFPDSSLYDAIGALIGPVLSNQQLEEELFDKVAPWVTPNLGFDYNEDLDYYFTNDTSLQSRAGFADEFDDLGTTLGMDLNTEIITFTSGVYEYRLQLWKGEYGFDNAYGAEVGIYVRPIDEINSNPYNESSPDASDILYNSLPEGHQITIRNQVMDENNKVLIDNRTGNYEEDHFWNLAIRTTKMEDAKDKLSTKTYLTIEDQQIRNDVVNALQADDAIGDIEVEGNEVKFTWN